MSSALFLKHSGARYPIICGAMYPCSNPELVAAVSQAGGIGIVQPVSLIYAHKMDFRAGMQKIRSLTQNPVGLNLLVEKSSKIYQKRNEEWLDIALEMGVRFFVTALGNPSWVIAKVKPFGGIVYHDVTEHKWAERAVKAGVDGMICVNNRAGGHAGTQTPAALYNALKEFGLPLICAGGVSTRADLQHAIELGYAGVQMGTRFIASIECTAHADYKKAIVDAQESDIVLSEKITGVPVSIIATDYVRKIGTKAGWFARYALRHNKLKHYARMYFTLMAGWQLKEAANKGSTYKEYFQAGKSVAGIKRVESVQTIFESLV